MYKKMQMIKKKNGKGGWDEWLRYVNMIKINGKKNNINSNRSKNDPVL